MFVRVSVDDYAVFREAFDNAHGVRDSAGSTGDSVYQSIDDPNDVTVRLDFPTVEAARAYSISDALRDCMKGVGIQGPPSVWFVDET